MLRNLTAGLLLLLLAGCEVPPPGDGKASDAALTAADSSGSTDTAAGYVPGQPWTGPTTATARYELDGKDWHALPFPNDVRREADGRLDLTGFPPAREGSLAGLLEQYLDHASEDLRGWSLQPTIYVQFDAPLLGNQLPTPEQTLQQDRIALVDVDPQSPEYKTVIPVLPVASGPTRGKILFPNLLMVQPIWGRPLRAQTTYALVVRRGLLAGGGVLGQPAVLKQALDVVKAKGPAPAEPKLAKLVESLRPLGAAIDAGVVKVPYEDVAAATVLTTGNPTAQLQNMARWVRDKAPVAKAEGWKLSKKLPGYKLYTATYNSPNFQKGDCPYDDEGSGGFVFDAKGDPIVQRTEKLRVAVAVPTDPRLVSKDGRLPVAMSAHGTGGDWMSFVEGGKHKIVDYLTNKGLAIVSIDQPMHGPRCDPPISGTVLDFKTFNFMNIAAGRSGFRQSALDSVFLARMLREGLLDVPADVTEEKKLVPFDPQQVLFIGHSQGGLSGSLLAAIEPSIKAYVLSGAGAGISLTLLLRKDPADIAQVLSSVLDLDPGELSEYHPAVALVQALADVTDPLSYAHEVFHRKNGERPPHVLLTEGLLDAATPSDTAETLAAALGLDVLAPAVHLSDAMKLGKTAVRPSPVQVNLLHGGFAVTGVVSQWQALDHFVIFKSEVAAKLYAEFLASTVEYGDAIAELP